MMHGQQNVKKKNHSLNLLFSEICPLWGFTKRRMVVTDISVKL